MDTTAAQRLATILLERPVAEYIEVLRAERRSWRAIAEQLAVDTNQQIVVSHETVRAWRTDGDAA